jgi:putative DNA primase/helicase
MRVELDDYLRPVLRELTAARLRHELAQLARFFKMRGKHEYDTYPPNHLIEDMLATPNPPLPVVTRVTECPTFAPDGTLQTAMGYHPASQTYYAPPSGLEIPPVPATPSTADLAEAKRLVLDELLADFPFVSDADRAHLVGLGLLPSARDLIPGPTPLHMVEAPMPGSGKGLAVEAALRAGCGRNIGAIAQARDDDEMRKRVTAMLRDGHPAIQIDNLTGALDSGSLSAALTLPAWTDRILGQTATIRIPIRCVWVATANNPVVSTEIARRSIRVRLDPKQDRPWEREGWRHPELLSWVDEHRGRLIWANLVLIQAWVAAGRPGFSGRVLGSYEQWSHVIGGILEHAGIPGFLGNLAEFYEQADIETAVWRAFVEAWWEAHSTTEVGTADLFPLAETVDGLDLDGQTDKARRTAFGKALSRQRDRVVGEYRITKVGELRRAARWRLLPTDGSGVLL